MTPDALVGENKRLQRQCYKPIMMKIVSLLKVIIQLLGSIKIYTNLIINILRSDENKWKILTEVWVGFIFQVQNLVK